MSRISHRCARCDRPVKVGDLVVEVRKITSVTASIPITITHDRGDAVAHVSCPTTETRS